jgi:hypothetical protein
MHSGHARSRGRAALHLAWARLIGRRGYFGADPDVSDGGADGMVELGAMPGIFDEPEPDEPGLVLALGEPGPPEVRESLQVTVPATVKQAMAIGAAGRSVRIFCSFCDGRESGRSAGLANTQQPPCRTGGSDCCLAFRKTGSQKTAYPRRCLMGDKTWKS